MARHTSSAYRPQSPNLPVYHANDEDWNEQGHYVGEHSPEAEPGDWTQGQEDEDDFGPGVTVSSSKPAKQEKPIVSDVQDEAYFDPLALVNCWELALLDLKMQHPDRFLPPTEAPLALSQKQTKAPLWYGPPPLPPVASTSKATAAPSPPPSFDLPTSHEPEPDSTGSKKRKRLTGSQKKARKQARLLMQEEDDARGPSFQPDSPPHLPSSLQLRPRPRTTPPPPPPQSLPSLRLPLPPPPIARLPTSFPSPPPITPLTGDEPPLDAETPEQLLEAALWSWFTCGYQTALYHASVGVATFRSSEAGTGTGTEAELEMEMEGATNGATT
ncbi:hypothetical protein JCM5296_006950 [Sporobolomyces johnsonii]